MAVFVLDASVTLAWCFEDEATNWTEAFLERFANALLIAARRKRIKPEHPQSLWDELGRLPIDIEPALTTVRGKEVLAVAEKHNLTVYDAAYLELARRYQLPLGTLDGDLRKAAQAEGLQLL